MATDSAKLAAATAIFYIIFFVSGMFIHYARTGEEYTLYYSLSRPQTWIAAVGGAIIGYGLWRHRAWAWWLGLAAVLFQMVGVSPKLIRFLAEGQAPPMGMLIVFGLFALFLLLLTLPKTRALCKR